jgi:hypothetical protein
MQEDHSVLEILLWEMISLKDTCNMLPFLFSEQTPQDTQLAPVLFQTYPTFRKKRHSGVIGGTRKYQG